MELQEMRWEGWLSTSLAAIPDLDGADETVWDALFARAEALSGRALAAASRREDRCEFHDALHLLLSTGDAAPRTWGARHHLSARAFCLRKRLWEAYAQWQLERLEERPLPPVPSDPRALAGYLLALHEGHPAARHPVFEYLCELGSLRDVKRFFCQESSVDARFDDRTALARIGLDGRAKDEYARSFAGEMGRGNPDRAHTRLFLGTARYVLEFAGTDASLSLAPCAEALACGNLQRGMALDRRHLWRLAGYLTAFELNAAWRCEKLVDACVRQGMESERLAYLTEHIDAGAGRARGLLEEIAVPLAAADERAPLEIAQGFALRLQAAQDSCDSLLREFMRFGF